MDSNQDGKRLAGREREPSKIWRDKWWKNKTSRSLYRPIVILRCSRPVSAQAFSSSSFFFQTFTTQKIFVFQTKENTVTRREK
jgi:hypothetical protein